MGWDEVFLEYRASDDPQGFMGAALLAKDVLLMRLAATWPLVTRELPPPPPVGAEIDLNNIWSLTRINFSEWAALAQVGALQVVTGFAALKGNRIIFPDGSLSHQAEALLKKEAAGKFMAHMNIKPGDLK